MSAVAGAAERELLQAITAGFRRLDAAAHHTRTRPGRLAWCRYCQIATFRPDRGACPHCAARRAA